MNNLAKLTILVSLLFLGGCAQHSGYYAGRSHSGGVGISVDSYIPFNSYYEHDTYHRRPVKHKSHAYNSGYDAHYYDNRHYDNRHKNKHYSKRKHGKYNHGNDRTSRHDYYSH